MRTSIGSVIVMPTPTAGPLIAAITGLVLRKMRSVRMPPPSRGTSSPLSSAISPRACALAPVEGLAAALEVGARAEAAALAGHDHDAHVVVGVGEVERLHQLLVHRRGVGVQPLGPVERDRGTWSSTSYRISWKSKRCS